ncbi:OmpA family protein [Methylacidiphilum caldifontis]|uniref:OmpA/MotB family protein n=1 Tax=Methylacidiphilum caldifontis TaxID=2795386 RepID=UPI001A8C0227|nr:OmpA family protein [Methylacidiphilum caldifontis]QSR88368.1 OmpA family protein [Methylacidiphilum caldifontis]
MDQKPSIVSVKVQRKKQSVFPAGGIGAVFFWVSLSVFLGATAIYFYGQYISLEKTVRVLKEEDELLKQENNKQRAVVDQLQAELAQTGSLLRSQEELLEKTTQSLKAVESKKGEEEAVSAKENFSIINEIAQKLKMTFAEQIQQGESFIIEQPKSIIVRFNKSILFGYGGVKISNIGRTLLKKLITDIKPFLDHSKDLRIEVCSYTDNDPPALEVQNFYPTNWEISAIRSAAVIRTLIQLSQLPEDIFSLAAGGETKPIADNNVPEGKEKNRRVEIIIYPEIRHSDFKATVKPTSLEKENPAKLQGSGE